MSKQQKENKRNGGAHRVEGLARDERRRLEALGDDAAAWLDPQRSPQEGETPPIADDGGDRSPEPR